VSQLRWRAATANIFAGALSILSLQFATAAPAALKEPTAAYAVRWNFDRNNASGGVVEVSGLSITALKTLREANWAVPQWQRLLAVRVEQGDLLTDVGLPPMLGSYHVESNLIRFQPQFPIEPGVKYRASFYPDQLPGTRATSSQLVTASFDLPRSSSVEPTTVVSQIYPSGDVLPENLLKFYVHFSASMSRGHIYDHIHLQTEAGKEVELPFLEIDEELWNPTMTRLTLFIDPGRIKRGVLPLEEIGPALEQGKRYTLLIDHQWKDGTGIPLKQTFQKTFQVGAPDRDPVDPSKWKIQPPGMGTRAPLTVSFEKPLDHALAQRVIRVVAASNELLDGKIALEDRERRWTFVPTQTWRRGAHALLVQKTIEDLAGNNIGKAFEVDLFEGVQRRFTNSTVRLPFEVR
jgi:hypothetical protein